ncbi:hypothetical protein N8611_01865, partial [bacterium]|nr:hypothetical protein [bacterium]
LEIRDRNASADSTFFYDGSHALLIGNAGYQAPEWPDLSTIPAELEGLKAAIDLLAMLEGGAISLDEQNQAAVHTILKGAWGELSGTALDALRDLTGN